MDKNIKKDVLLYGIILLMFVTVPLITGALTVQETLARLINVVIIVGFALLYLIGIGKYFRPFLLNKMGGQPNTLYKLIELLLLHVFWGTFVVILWLIDGAFNSTSLIILGAFYMFGLYNIFKKTDNE